MSVTPDLGHGGPRRLELPLAAVDDDEVRAGWESVEVWPVFLLPVHGEKVARRAG